MQPSSLLFRYIFWLYLLAIMSIYITVSTVAPLTLQTHLIHSTSVSLLTQLLLLVTHMDSLKISNCPPKKKKKFFGA